MSLPHWKGLLKWSLSKTDPENREEEVKPMSKEDLKFLEGAMASVQNHEKEISNAVSDVNTVANHFAKSSGQLNVEDTKTLLRGLEKLEEHFEDHPSNPSSVVRTGLLDSFTLLLNSEDNDVLAATLSIISCAFSNNESILEEASKTKLLPNLLKLKEKLKETELEPKLITALSSSVRNCKRAEVVFITLDGLTYLKECLDRSNFKTRERAILLFNHFISLDRVGKLILAKLDPYSILKKVIPVDPVNHGIQFSEITCTLICLMLQKHRDILSADELKDIAMEIYQDLEYLESLRNSDYDTIVELLKKAKHF